MGILAGKKILVTGVLTDASIAFHIARLAQEEGATVILSSYGRVMSLTTRIAGRLPQPAPCILNVFLDLPLLPARCRIAEVRFIDKVVRHGEEAHVDLTLLPAADAINCCLRSAWPRTDGGQASLSYIPRSGTPPKTLNACQWALNSISWVCNG